jgi:hypothetical protein
MFRTAQPQQWPHLAFHRRMRQSLVSQSGSGDDTKTALNISWSSSALLKLHRLALSEPDTYDTAAAHSMARHSMAQHGTARHGGEGRV